MSEDVRQSAAKAAESLTFQSFQDQVLPFLDSDVAILYDQYAWDGMQRRVIGELLP